MSVGASANGVPPVSAADVPPLDMLIPQRGPMRLLGGVTAWSATDIDTFATVDALWPFVRQGEMRAVVCFELMTQSVAAFLMLINLKTGEPPPRRIPVVTRIHEIKLHRASVPAGTPLHAHADLEWGDGEMGIFRANVRDSQGPIAESRFTVTRVPHDVP